ncbi:hypothetical protein Bealeia1_01005 [Candidatus Bealeia paramacronuclearis]|uniref:Uncharacterized protein n=1 Tax=Candidatus Bealeia paramacronuclearis TaxID=1921001 RepID=A0ABZ2C3A8_9PROT|nr:hypothetical protein [Candidatus Bealeia paramacronuclearis]
MDLNTDQGKKDLAEAYTTSSNPEIEKWAYSSITDNGANKLLDNNAAANNMLYQSDVSIRFSSSTNTDCIYELIKNDQGQITTYLKFKLTKQ